MNNTIRQNIDTHILDLLQIERTLHSISYDSMKIREVVNNLESLCKLIIFTKKQLFEYAREEERKYMNIPKYLKEAGHADIYKSSAGYLYKASSMLNTNELQNYIQELKIGNRPELYMSFYDIIRVLIASKWDE